MNKDKAPRIQSDMGVYENPESTVKLGTDIEAKIGLQLRAMYSQVLSQGIPDRFAKILDRLDETASDQAEAARMTDNEVSDGPIH
jgi:Anti-sigma factor NepR